MNFGKQKSWNIVSKGQIKNISALVQIVGWRWIGENPLSEPMVAQFNDTYMHHPASDLLNLLNFYGWYAVTNN